MREWHPLVFQRLLSCIAGRAVIFNAQMTNKYNSVTTVHLNICHGDTREQLFLKDPTAETQQ